MTPLVSAYCVHRIKVSKNDQVKVNFWAIPFSICAQNFAPKKYKASKNGQEKVNLKKNLSTQMTAFPAMPGKMIP